MTVDEAAAITLYVPCDVVSYRLRVGYGTSLSAIEQAVIRAVHAVGLDRAAAGDASPVRLRDLNDLLHVGHRVTLDLVHDLWRKRYLQVDHRTSSIRLAPDVLRHVERDTLDELGGAEVAEKTVDLMVDRLVGRMLTRRGAKTPAVPRLAVEPEPDDTTVDHVPPGELTAALLRALNTDRGQDRNELELAERPPERFQPRLLHIRSRHRIALETGGEQRRWIPLDVTVTDDPDLGRLRITVLDRTLTPQQRRLAEDRLTAIVEDIPTGSLSRALQVQAESVIDGGEPFGDLLEELAYQLQTLTAVPGGDRREVHRELRGTVRQIEDSLSELAEGQVDIVTVDVANVDRHIREVCSSARHQLVVMAPRLTSRIWEHFDDLVRDAMSQSVQVVVLWGERPGAVLEERVKNLLVGLHADFPGVTLVRPLTSCRIRTWAVVADDGDALIGGRDQIDGPGIAATRLSAPVDARAHAAAAHEDADRPGSGTVRAVLRWAASTVPDGRTSRLVLSGGGDFSNGRVEAAPQRRVQIQVPEPPPDGCGTAEQFAVGSWAEAWAAVHQELVAARSQIARPTPRLVEDLRHADHLWLAIRHAKHRLVIASDHLDRGVVDEYLVNMLRNRLAAGLQVTFALPSSHRSSDAGSPRERLERLARQFPGQLRIAPAAGRFLVCDEDVLLSSFDYLRDGIRGAGKGRHRRSAQLGVFVRDSALASRLCSAVGAPPTMPDAGSSDSTAVVRVADVVSVRARQRILNRRALDGDVVGAVKHGLACAEDPWALVAALDGAADDHTFELVVARCLLDHGNRASAEVRRRYHRRLVEGRWRAGDYPTAAALHRSDGDPALRPRAVLASLAGALDTVYAADALDEARRPTDLDAAERAAVLAVACVHLVRRPGERSEAIVRALASAVAGPWHDLANTLLEWQVWAPGRPLAEAARQLRVVQAHGGELEAAWNALERATVLAGQPPKHLDGSIKTVHALFRSGAILGVLKAACDRRDIDAVTELMATQLPAAHDPAVFAAELLDRTWEAATKGRGKPLYGDPRVSYLGRLIAVIESARRLAVAAQPPTLDPQDRIVREMRPLADRVTALLPTLRQQAEASDVLESHLTSRMIARLAVDLGLEEGEAGEAFTVVGGSPETARGELVGPRPGDGGPALAAVLRTSSVRWRFPELAIELARDEPGPELIEQCILRRIARPLSETEAGRLLIESRQFELAAQLIDEAPLSAQDARQLVMALRAAQRTLRTEIEERLKAVQQQREQLHADWPGAAPARVTDLVARLDEAPKEVLDQVALLEKMAADAEKELVKELERRLSDTSAGRGIAGDAWTAIVSNCIGEGEYDVARSLLDHPGLIPEGGPAMLRALGPWRDAANLELVLGALLAPRVTGLHGEAQPVVDHLAPPPYDEDGWAVIRALQKLVDAETADWPDAAAVRELVTVLHQFMGVTDVPCEVDALGHGARSTVFLAPDGRLPQLQVFGDRRLALWVAATDVPPPVEVQRPVAWLVPEIRPPQYVDHPGVAVLGVDDLLLIVASQAGGAPLKPADRQMQLLRRIGPALGTTYLVGEKRGVDLRHAPSRDHCLAWLFDLLGCWLDQVTRSALLYESGARPDDLRVLADALLERREVRAVARGSAWRQSVGLDDLHHVRRDTLIREKRLEKIVTSLSRDPLSRAALFTLVWMDPLTIHSHSLSEVSEGIAYVIGVEPDDGEFLELLTNRELQEAVARLQTAGLVSCGDPAPESVQLASAALRDVLASIPDLEGVVSQAMVAIRSRFDERWVTSLMPIRQLVNETIDHHTANLMRDIDNLVEEITRTDNSAEVSRLRDRMNGLWSKRLNITDLQAQADRTPEPCLVRELVEAQFRRLRMVTGGRNELEVIGGKEILITINDWLFGQALYYLLDNARLAIEARGSRHGYIDVRIEAEDAWDAGTTGRCLIDIEDSGTGMDPQVVNRLRRGERFTTRGGKGIGFQVATSWFRTYRGDLEIVTGTGSARLGGAHLRGWLPLAAQADHAP